MKLYSDFTGKFQMDIPLDWEYKNPSLYKKTEEGAPQAFGFYDKTLGAFQISCKKVTDHIKNIIATRREPIQSSDSKKLIFSEQLVSSDGQNVYAFSCAVDDHYFFATYIVKPTKQNQKKVENELRIVREVLATVKFIKEPYRQIVITQRRFDLYMSAIATIMELKSKAIETDSHIEYIVFSANHIDALLRLSIILNNQLARKNEDIDLSLLFQAETDQPIMERTIYKKCLDQAIISQTIFNELENLYKERNKVIHRFIITDIRSEDVFKLALKYEKLYDKIDNVILQLEKKQIEEGVGVWGKNPTNGLSYHQRELLKTKIRDKTGRLPIKK
jgi:hypothetical protein